jgi:hypothetical protein
VSKPAELEMAFHNEDSSLADLGQNAGRGQTTNAGPDDDDVIGV